MKNTQMKSQKITSCITHTKEAHLTDQTDQLDPAPTYQHQGPPGRHTKKGGGQGRQGGAGRTHPGSRPGAFWQEIRSYPLEVG